MLYRLGLPLWGNADWRGNFFTPDAKPRDFLSEYASVFNTVEGNTTFYALPSEAQVESWLEQTASQDFKFSLKMPKMITHELKLQRCDLAVKRFFQHIEILQPKLGPVMIQLPPTFSSQYIDVFHEFIKQLPAAFQYAVEVRHEDFFQHDADNILNELLHKYRIDRVTFDTRALFDSNASDTATIDAKSKKPNFPVEAYSIGRHPVVRFIGAGDERSSLQYFNYWVKKIRGWVDEGKEPYLFIHMPDNAGAPALAQVIHEQLQASISHLEDLPRWPYERSSTHGQMGLF